MNARATAFAFAFVAIALTIAQDVVPARDWYHSWEYVTIIAIAILVMAMHVWRIVRKRETGKRFALALCGAIAVGVAGLLSGLIGPDTVTVVGTPGTVTPVPDLSAAAFFPAADAQSILGTDADITLRSRVSSAVTIGPRPLPLGLSVAFTERKPAAYIVARNVSGDRLTVTQPNSPVFLSPVMLFRQQQEIHGKSFPFDTFAVPALHRVVRILYFSAADLAAFRAGAAPASNAPGAILSVTDDAGAQQGLIMAPSGHDVTIGGMRITATLGTYPVLQVASAPQPFVVIGGLILFVVAGLWSTINVQTATELGEPAPT